MVGWWDGGMVGWWVGGLVGWWDGGLRAAVGGLVGYQMVFPLKGGEALCFNKAAVGSIRVTS